MSDFYTVLKDSILRRGLRSPVAREEIYGQARRALITQLWSLVPALAEDEIDTRIMQFDTAVQEIESDVSLAFAADEEPSPDEYAYPEEPVPEPEEPPPPVYDGYDEAADDAQERDDLPASCPYREANRSDQYLPEPEAPAIPHRLAAMLEKVETSRAYFAERAKEASLPRREYLAEPTQELLPVVRPRPARRTEFGYGADETFEDPAFDDDAPLADDDRDYDDDADFPVAKPRRARRRDRDLIRILVTVVATLAVVLAGFSAYVFYPVLFGTGSHGRTAGADARLVGDPASAEQVPKRNLAVANSFVLFDGHDPTVFQGTAGNPIQFDQDAAGGFARVASAASAAGVKAVVAPGIASAIAGQTIRVTIVARSARENGADGLRFAYQAGPTASFWQEAKLTADYRAFGMIWRAPAAVASSGGDYLVIEPGVPGDGTAAEIQSIKIDVLAP